jgi:hypothetical protein
MTDRPILFSAEMVRAILDGRKTQTRRAIKPVPTFNGVGAIFDEGDRQEDFVEPYWVFPETCKYGKPGDLLWVREAWTQYPIELNPEPCDAWYKATSNGPPPPFKWRPSIHMPRWASRITLEVKGVRVERLQDITEDDAKAEGAKAGDWPERPECDCNEDDCAACSHYPALHKPAFRHIWNKINGPGAWDENPWVWVISFERVKP